MAEHGVDTLQSGGADLKETLNGPQDSLREKEAEKQQSSHEKELLHKSEDEEGRNHSSDASDTEKSQSGVEVIENDPFRVSWDGPDDPKNPMNWPSKKKVPVIVFISLMTLITPLASSMFAPGVPQVLADFHSTSDTLASFVVSVYILGYVAGPVFLAPLGELYGRTWIYHISNILFIIFTVGCALSTNLNMLIGFRFLAGTFGATPVVLGSGTIADTYPQEKRGGVMALWKCIILVAYAVLTSHDFSLPADLMTDACQTMGPLLGPVLGPICGGFIAQQVGWRWVFWVLAIASGVITTAGIIVLRETYAPVLLERKAAALRKSTGDDRYQPELYSGESARQKFKRAIHRPLKMLFLSPVVLAMSLYMAVVYGYLYLLFTTITEVFEGQYHFSQGIVGLAYLGIGIGMFIGLFAFGMVSDKTVKRAQAKAKSHGAPVKPEVRLPPMIPATFAVPIGLFWYGWSADKGIFWIMPIIGTGFVGLGLIGAFLPISTYLVDSFTIHAASAMAANTILRSLLGALLPLAGQPLYAALGLGWGNSLLAFIALTMCPIPLLFLKYGEWLRTSPRFKVQF